MSRGKLFCATETRFEIKSFGKKEEKIRIPRVCTQKETDFCDQKDSDICESTE